jgi:Icc protein
MPDKKKDDLLYDHNNDGVNRRGFLKCMAWAGTGAFCVMQGGVLKSYSLSRLSELNAAEANGELSFVQISDSHMGFNKPANPDVAGTLKAAVDKINGLTTAPEFMLHTGDISHLSKPEEFDTVDQILKSAKPKDVFYVPGEHDVLNDDGKHPRHLRALPTRCLPILLQFAISRATKDFGTSLWAMGGYGKLS